jgi:hypothetical protein
MTTLVETPAEVLAPASKVSLPHAKGGRRQRIDFFFVLVLLIGVAAGANQVIFATDPDLWWHVRTGSWILQHRAIPVHDVFSSFAMGKTWIVYEWLFDVPVSKIFGLWGLRGILTATALLVLACATALTALLARYTRLSRAMILTAIATLAMSPLHSPRPWLFTILFFTIELNLLLQAWERNRPAWLLPVIPLFILWANIHIRFVYGLGLIGLFALLGSIPATSKWRLLVAGHRSLRAVWFWVILAGSLLATLVNPYGWRVYSEVIQYATDNVVLNSISEMRALQFRDFTDWIALLLICSAWFSLGTAQKKSALLVSLMAVSCWFGFHRGRDIWFPIIVSTVALASRIGSSEDDLRPLGWRRWAVAAPLGMALALPMLLLTGPSESDLQKAVGEHYPNQASAYIQSHDLEGPLYNTFDWGGYLIWRLPDLPVSIDGRTNVQGSQHLTRSIESEEGRKNWTEDRELMKAKTLLLNRDSALASILRSDARFRLVYEDKIAVIFLRQIAAL